MYIHIYVHTFLSLYLSPSLSIYLYIETEIATHTHIYIYIYIYIYISLECCDKGKLSRLNQHLVPASLDGFVTVSRIAQNSSPLAPTAARTRTSEPPRRFEPILGLILVPRPLAGLGL